MSHLNRKAKIPADVIAHCVRPQTRWRVNEIVRIPLSIAARLGDYSTLALAAQDAVGA